MNEIASRASVQDIWNWLGEVPDPEIPVISVVDLGIVREVRWDASGLVVTVTPTYSGCPATEVIAQDIRTALEQHGIEHAAIETRLSPAWTTDWLTPAAKERLRDYGIAPPAASSGEQVIDISRIRRVRQPVAAIACPRCGSQRTQVVSQFGSTPCKALYRCEACREPFDYFKPH